MSEEQTEQFGFLIGLSFFALPATYFFLRGCLSRPGPRRLTRLSLACGLLGLVYPEASAFLQPLALRVLLYDGSARVAVGLAGILLGIAALGGRKADPKAGVLAPALGMVLNGLLAVVGLGIALLSNLAGRGDFDPASTWVYRSRDLVGVRLPSDSWKQSVQPDGKVLLVHRLPEMVASIEHVEPVHSQEGFKQFLAEQRAVLQKIKKGKPLPAFTEGVNEAGNAYAFFEDREEHPDRSVYVAFSLTWSRKTRLGVVLLFEGHPKLRSKTLAVAQQEAFEKAARSILLSVE